MSGCVHLVAFSRFCRSPIPQFPRAEADCGLSSGDASSYFLAVWLQNGFSIKRQPILVSV